MQGITFFRVILLKAEQIYKHWQNCYVGQSHHLRIEFFKLVYHKVASSDTSCFEAHAGLFRLSMKGIFNAYVLQPLAKS